MFNFSYECQREGNLVKFRITGFMPYQKEKIENLKEEIIKEIKAQEEKKIPYKILFDLRGLKVLDPRVGEALHAINKVVYESSAVKVGTVLDSVIAKLQQLRVANEYPMDNALIFSDYDKCIKWLNDEIDLQLDPVSKKFGA